jgi:hypothetical protein
MNNKYLIATVVLALVAVLLVVGIVVYYKRPRKLKKAKTDNFSKRWKELQKLLSDKDNWNEAIIRADKMLDEALRKSHVKGKSMGERLVAAEKMFSDHDAVWFGHKLCGRIKSDNPPKLRANDVKKALLGIGQGLKDIGALK